MPGTRVLYKFFERVISLLLFLSEDEKTEILKGWVTCPRSHGCRWQSWEWPRVCPTLGPFVLSSTPDTWPKVQQSEKDVSKGSRLSLTLMSRIHPCGLTACHHGGGELSLQLKELIHSGNPLGGQQDGGGPLSGAEFDAKRGKQLPPHFTEVQHPIWKASKPPGLAADKERASTAGPGKDHRPSWTCWNRAGPCGAPGHGSLSVSPISCLEGAESSLHDLPWVLKGRSEQLLIREGRGSRDKTGAAKKQQCSLGAGSWFHLKGYT